MLLTSETDLEQPTWLFPSKITLFRLIGFGIAGTQPSVSCQLYLVPDRSEDHAGAEKRKDQGHKIFLY